MSEISPLSFQNSILETQNKLTKSNAKSNALEDKLSSLNVKNASDEELMAACKDFETYLVEQVIKKVKDTLAKSEEDENDYNSYFKDILYEEYAKKITDSGDIGLAQQLYESMKRDYKI